MTGKDVLSLFCLILLMIPLATVAQGSVEQSSTQNSRSNQPFQNGNFTVSFVQVNQNISAIIERNSFYTSYNIFYPPFFSPPPLNITVILLSSSGKIMKITGNNESEVSFSSRNGYVFVYLYNLDFFNGSHLNGKVYVISPSLKIVRVVPVNPEEYVEGENIVSFFVNATLIKSVIKNPNESFLNSSFPIGCKELIYKVNITFHLINLINNSIVRVVTDKPIYLQFIWFFDTNQSLSSLSLGNSSRENNQFNYSYINMINLYILSKFYKNYLILKGYEENNNIIYYVINIKNGTVSMHAFPSSSNISPFNGGISCYLPLNQTYEQGNPDNYEIFNATFYNFNFQVIANTKVKLFILSCPPFITTPLIPLNQPLTEYSYLWGSTKAGPVFPKVYINNGYIYIFEGVDGVFKTNEICVFFTCNASTTFEKSTYIIYQFVCNVTVLKGNQSASFFFNNIIKSDFNYLIQYKDRIYNVIRFHGFSITVISFKNATIIPGSVQFLFPCNNNTDIQIYLSGLGNSVEVYKNGLYQIINLNDSEIISLPFKPYGLIGMFKGMLVSAEPNNVLVYGPYTPLTVSITVKAEPNNVLVYGPYTPLTVSITKEYGYSFQLYTISVLLLLPVIVVAFKLKKIL